SLFNSNQLVSYSILCKSLLLILRWNGLQGICITFFMVDKSEAFASSCIHETVYALFNAICTITALVVLSLLVGFSSQTPGQFSEILDGLFVVEFRHIVPMRIMLRYLKTL